MVNMWHRTIALIICTLLLHSAQNIKIGGPTKYQLEQIGPCEMETKGLVYYDNYRISKYNKTTYTYSGTVVQKVEFHDGLKLRLYAAVWGNGGWRQNFFNNTISKPCTFMKNMIPSFVKLMGQQVHGKGCPLPPREYQFKDLPLIVTNISIPIPYGRYKAEFLLLDGEEKLGCLEFICRIEPQ